jgi:prephenate dehydratase
VTRARDRIAFQGEPGAFSHLAIRQMLARGVEVVPCPTFEQAFRRLADGQVDGAVIPIENTLHGSVHENYDHLLRFGLPIVAETSLRIVHNLVALPGVRFRQVTRVFSHPVALGQCRDFFDRHRRLEQVPFYDTAGSVKMLVDQRPDGGAAIASALAAEIYGCRILQRSIEDDRENFTRFFLLRHKMPEDAPTRPRRGWKTSLVFATPNAPGALFRALSAFSLRDLDLTKIESRPFRGRRWEYLFYLDFLGHVDDQVVRNALRHLDELSEFVRVLGCYPRSD